jgi:hypothetical protein
MDGRKLKGHEQCLTHGPDAASMIFHHAGRGRINAFFSSINGYSEANAPGDADKSGNQGKNANGVMHEHMIFIDPVGNSEIHCHRRHPFT